ncbi:hypothetical protein [Ruminiclostridium papyrosolvens]|uniref:Membrane protein n=1 Tax=Ruminiclostridium papyrosolvens C7 TaxID=1330534 RepID=U4QYC1_9FIRM|nr:hypothetical protein [Ruminiclostridium papyrosolvens]EPR09612.1 membrane protein [Ruminiclostridium papyrosolvens C7]
MIIFVIIGYTFLVIFSFIPLYKKKLWSDFWVNSILGVLSFTIAVLISFNVKIPSPAKPIANLITSIFGK